MKKITIGWLVWIALAGGAAICRGQEKSVNPGINKSFQDPDVSQFVGRFERDGREVFDKRGEVLDACRLKPGMAIADVGAGTGLFTRLFAQKVGHGGRVYAVDISTKFVDHIEAKCREQKIQNVVAQVCQPDDVALPTNSVDLVFICDTYHHFEFPDKTMRSIHRALRPRGELILIDFHRIEGRSSEWTLGHVRAGQETFVKEITSTGFQQIEEKKDLLQENYFLRFAKDRPGNN